MTLLLKPNWQGGMSVGYTFNTDIITSRNGSETRSALIYDPRITTQFSTWFSDEDAECLQAQLDTGVSETFYVPDPVREAVLSADLPVGIDQVTLVTTPDWVVEGASVLLTNPDGYFEHRTVQSVAGLLIDFVEIGDVTFVAGAQMCGAFPVISQSSFSAVWLTAGVLEADLKLRVLPGTDELYDPAAWSETLDGTPVFDIRPNWIDPSKITIASNADINDFNRGVIGVNDFRGFPTQVTSWTYSGINVTEVQKIIDFFRLMKGMRGTFHIPSWASDLTPITGVVSGGNELGVSGRCSYETYRDMAYNNGITLTLRDGTLVHRRLASITAFNNSTGWGYDWGNNYGGVDADPNTLLTIEGTWPADIDMSDILKISWLRKSRFAKDTLSVNYVTAHVADIAVSIRSLRDDI